MGFLETLGSFIGSSISPGWGTAIGSGLGSLGDDLFKEGLSDQNDREARQWQEQMYDKQFANNTQFWYEQQRYNSPENQVERLKAAGINPAAALGSIQPGQMGSVGSSSVPSAGVSQRVTPQRLNSTLEGLLSAQYSQLGQKETVKSLELDNKQKEIDIETQAMRNIFQLWDILSNIGKNNSGVAKDYNDMQIANFLAYPQAQKLLADTLKSITSSELDTIDAMRSWTELQYLPFDKAIQYQSSIADIELKYEQGRLTKQQTLTEIQKTNGEYFRNKGQEFINSLNKKTEEFVLRKSEAETLSLEGQNRLFNETFRAKKEGAIRESLDEKYRSPRNARHGNTMFRKYGHYPDE